MLSLWRWRAGRRGKVRVTLLHLDHLLFVLIVNGHLEVVVVLLRLARRFGFERRRVRCSTRRLRLTRCLRGTRCLGRRLLRMLV